MLVSTIILYFLAAFGLASLILIGMVATPLPKPEPLDFITQGALQIDQTSQPNLSTFQARDGTHLTYRAYPSRLSKSDHTILLVHGSSAQSVEMNQIATSFAASGFNAIALDIRGHGASGQRGDIAYIGQLEDDLKDLLFELRKENENSRFTLVGHSLGGGFAARIAASFLNKDFEHFILLAPYLGPSAPTSGEGNNAWAKVNLPRIIALDILNRFGVSIGQSLPVIAFANDSSSQKFVTSVYSYRLLVNFGAGFNWRITKSALSRAALRISILVGADDELMISSAFQRELEPLGIDVKVLPSINHMGIVNQPHAIAKLIDTVNHP